jgi:hypothetical protein
MSKIPATMLATGDVVYFPRLGRRRIIRMTGANSLWREFTFDDGRTHSIEHEKLVEAELRTDELVPLPGEIIRVDRETNRESVISPSLHGFHSEIADSFKTYGRVASLPASAALAELRKGAVLFTAKAIYFMARNAPRFPLPKDLSSLEWQGN